MRYEKTPIKHSKNLGKQTAKKTADTLGTGTLLWLLIKRHRVGLLATWAVVMTALYVCPPLPDMLIGVLGR